MKANTQSQNRTRPNRQVVDLDPFSVSIIQDLLQGHSEWKGVEDIVKLTFRALTDVVRAQSQSLREIKATLPTRASKTELTTGLSLKANISDVSRTITEVSNALETKISLAEFHTVLKDYATKSDVQQVLINKANIDDLKQLMKHNSSVYERNSSSTDRFLEINVLHTKIQDMQKRLSGFVTVQEMQEILTILDQKASIAEINQALENKVSKQALTASLQKKLSKSELQPLIAKKADIADLQYIVNNLETKVDLSTIEKLTQVIQKKCDKTDINVVLASLSEKADKAEIELVIQATQEMKGRLEKQIAEMSQSAECDRLKKRIDGLQDSLSAGLKDMASKLSLTDISPMLSNLRYELVEETTRIKAETKSLHEEILSKGKEQSDNKNALLREVSEEIRNWKKKEEKLYEEIDEVRRRAEEIGAKCVDKKDWIEFKSQVVTNLEEKLESEEIQLAFNKWQIDINKRLKEDREEMISIVSGVQKTVGTKISMLGTELSDMASVVNKKLDRQDHHSFEDALKKIRRDVDECRKTVDKVYGELPQKLTLSQYEADLAEIKKRLDSLNKQLGNKANIKDVCVLVDAKPNAETINNAIKEINNELDSKVSEADLKLVLADQASINETLCSENIVGRWLWLSGEVKTGSLVPWESESVNTLPDNFLWDKDKTNILALASGMYEVTVCFFCKSKPVISILVNSDVVFTKAVSLPTTTEEGGVTKKRKQKEIVGTKLVEYMMLPSRARISVAFNGEHGAEGFLNVKRL